MIASADSAYPRSQLRRDQWQPLDGPWRFTFDDQQRFRQPAEVTQWPLTIRVPMPPKSQASGVGDRGFHRRCWYQREFEIEAKGARILLHFGAVDYQASLADEKHMLFIDTQTLACRKLRLPAGSEIVVIDSGVSRSLATSRYNERREECERAARLLGVPALRDIVDPAQVVHLPEPLARRARRVVTKNNRVLRAAEGVDAAAFGAFMNASHGSLRDDFDVSIPALDLLVAQLQAEPEVHGARLTGAGFGGACVALCREGTGAAAAHRVLPAYDLHGVAGRLLVPAP